MLLRFLATSLLILSPVLVAAQMLPESYNACRLADDPQAGIAACKEALNSSALLQAERARAYLMLGTYQRETGALSESRASLDEAARIAPNAPAIPAERAILLHLSGDLAGAKEAHARAFSLGSASVASLNNRGVTMLALGDTAGAIADFESALAITSDNGRVLDNRATALCRAGKLDASIADRLAAIELGDADVAELEAAMALSGFQGGLGTDASDPDGALARWTAAGCPGASPGFM